MAECDACGKPVPDTAYVCRGCVVDFAGDPNDPRRPGLLNTAADLWPELLTTITGQARMTTPGPHRRGNAPAAPIRPDSGRMRHYADQTIGQPTGLPFNWNASVVREDVRIEVTTWARIVVEEHGGDPPAGIPEVMRWLTRQLDWCRYQKWAGEMWDGLDTQLRRIASAVDRPPPRVDAGECGSATEQGPCRQWLSSSPGAAIVHCPVCRATHSAADRRATLLAEARQLRGTATEVAQWLTMLGLPTPAATVRKWAARARIKADIWGRYAFHEVETLRHQQPATRQPARSAA